MRFFLTTTALYAAASFGVQARAAEQLAQSLTLPTVNVPGDRADRTFETPAAVSTVTGDQIREGGDTNRLLETVPGVAAGGFASQPGISINIRGMEGLGRVNMMVEGVRQTFRNGGHEGGSFAYVDPGFLAGIDVERGAVTGRSGMGALAGAVNFRLLNVEDILRPDQDVGGRLTGMTGTNGYQWNSNLVTAMRLGEGVSALAGVSGRQNSNYDNGDGDRVPFTEQSLRSGLFRLNWDPTTDQRLTLTSSVYTNRFVSNFYDQTMQVNMGQLAYRYHPANPLIDLEARFSYNQTRMNNYLTEAGKVSTTATGRRILDTALQGDVSNTSRFAMGSLDIAWEYGVQYVTDDVETRRGGVNGDGRLSIGGAYSETTLTRGIFDATLGLRYDHYEMDAEGYALPAIGVPVTGDYKADRSEGKLSPRVTLAARVLPGVQPYVSYGFAFRPPTVYEAMYSGGHTVGGTSTSYPNPFLKAETSRGWEVGTNILQRDLLTEGDRLRMKVAYFDNDVDDLINLVTVRGSRLNGTPVSFYFHENVPGTSRMRGVELEGGYDIGIAYITAAYTHSSIDYAQGASRNFLPRSNLTIDAGTRLFERQVTLGGRLRRVGRTESRTEDGGTLPISAYTMVDLYGNWSVTSNLNVFANATNIGNETYTVPTQETLSGGRGRTIIAGLTLRF